MMDLISFAACAPVVVVVVVVRCHNVKNGKKVCEVTKGKSSKMLGIVFT